MPAPHNVWVILIGTVPTSFRAKTREELVPTFKQLQRTQPEVALRWFERGKVWENPEAARAASLLAAAKAKERRPRRDPSLGPPRGKEWRPGGEHKDPKARFELTRDQKRAKFKRNLIAGNDAPEPSSPPRAETTPVRPVKKRPAGDPFS